MIELREPSKKFFPVSHRLWWWRTHCNEVHNANGEFGMNVMKWHKEHHPDCKEEYPKS